MPSQLVDARRVARPSDQIVGAHGAVVVVVARVVEVTAPTVVDGDGGRVVGGGTRRGAVEAIVVVSTGTVAVVVDVVAAVVVGATVDTGPTVTLDTPGVVVVVDLVVVDTAGIDLTAVVGSDFGRLVANLTGRDPPGTPPSTSAPTHRAATPTSPAQPRQARPLRCCSRLRPIASSSTICCPT